MNSGLSRLFGAFEAYRSIQARLTLFVVCSKAHPSAVPYTPPACAERRSIGLLFVPRSRWGLLLGSASETVV